MRNRSYTRMWKPAPKKKPTARQQDLISEFSVDGYERLSQEQLALLTKEYIDAILEGTAFKDNDAIVNAYTGIMEHAKTASVERLRNAFYLIARIVMQWDNFNLKEKEEHRPYKPFPPVQRQNMTGWLQEIEQALDPNIKPEQQAHLPYRLAK